MAKDKKTLSLKVPPGQLMTLRKAVERIEEHLALPAVAEVVSLWPTLPEEVRQEIAVKAPVFASIVGLAGRIGR